MSRRHAVTLAAVVFAVACSDENNRPQNQVTFDRDQGDPNNSQMDAGGNTTAADMGTSDASTPSDMGVDFAVAAEGFMHGSWLASRTGGADIATLEIRHEVGESSLTGTYQMQEPAAFGRLGGTTWQNETFTTSWTVVIDGLDERFSLTMCAAVDGSEVELACRFADPQSGDVVDATMTRQ